MIKTKFFKTTSLMTAISLVAPSISHAYITDPDEVVVRAGSSGSQVDMRQIDIKVDRHADETNVSLRIHDHASTNIEVMKSPSHGGSVAHEVTGLGRVVCDANGNISIKGAGDVSSVYLNVVTGGQVKIRNTVLKSLSVRGRMVAFGEGVEILEDSVFDVDQLYLKGRNFHNHRLMRFLSPAEVHGRSKLVNTGEIRGQSRLLLRLMSGLDNEAGFIHSEGLTQVSLDQFADVKLGKIQGRETHLISNNPDEVFTLTGGEVYGSERVDVIGEQLTMPETHFHTPLLSLNAGEFEFAEQSDVERTVIRRNREQSFKLAKDYVTSGAVEFWDEGFNTESQVELGMATRFGEDGSELPAHEGEINLLANLRAEGGIAFFTPSKVISATQQFVELVAKAGPLKVFATLFNASKAHIGADSAYLYSPGGNVIGHLAQDAGRRLIATFYAHGQCSGSFNLGGDISSGHTTFMGQRTAGGYDGRFMLNLPVAMSHGSLQVRNNTHIKGPWQQKGYFRTRSLILEGPGKSTIEGATVIVDEDAYLPGADLTLVPHQAKFDFIYHTYGGYRRSHPRSTGDFIASDLACMIVNGNLTGTGKVTVIGSKFHAHAKSPELEVASKDLKSYVFQKFFEGTEAEAWALGAAPGNYRALRRAGRSITLNTNSIAHNGCTPYAIGFLDRTDNFAGAKQLFPAQISFGEGVVLPADSTNLEGNIQAPALLITMGEGGANVGSLTVHKEFEYHPLQSLMPDRINLHTTRMAENLGHTMQMNPGVGDFFRFRPRFWFNSLWAQSFYGDLRPYVRVQNPKGGFSSVEGQVLFTLSPSMLMDQVQQKALQVLGRGTLEDHRPIDGEQIVELHWNLVNYLEETGLEGATLTQALVATDQQLPVPQKPFIYYTSMVGAEGVPELTPQIYLPKDMHKKSGIRTKLLLTIPEGMSFRDLLQFVQGNPDLQAILIEHFVAAPHLLTGINREVKE